jgi:hypothetical protein
MSNHRTGGDGDLSETPGPAAWINPMNRLKDLAYPMVASLSVMSIVFTIVDA